MPWIGHHQVPVADIVALAVGDNTASQGDLNLRISLKKTFDRRQCARQILLVAIQVTKNITSRTPVAAVYGGDR